MSPDERYLAFGHDDGRDVSIWVHDLKAGRAPRRLTFGGRNRYPVWSADSRRVTFQSDRDGDPAIYWQPADGSGTADRLTSPEKGTAHIPTAWSPTGSVLLFDVADGKKFTLMTFTPHGQKGRTVWRRGVGRPDDRHVLAGRAVVAYTTREVGRDTSSAVVFVQPYPATGALFQVSKNTEDGHHPAWATDGKELHYTPGPGAVLVGVPVTLKPAFTMGEAVMLPRAFTNAPPAMQRTLRHDPERKVPRTDGPASRTDSASGQSPDRGRAELVRGAQEEVGCGVLLKAGGHVAAAGEPASRGGQQIDERVDVRDAAGGLRASPHSIAGGCPRR